jgi:molybdopterin molybdotransferase
MVKWNTYARDKAMKEFFKVTDLEQVLELVAEFPQSRTELLPLDQVFGRTLAEDITAPHDLPEFSRATMDGFAVPASSTFGASESSPAFLAVTHTVGMGEAPTVTIGPAEACRISTGGMLPEGSDSVVMIEHTETLDETTIEIYRSVAPGQHVLEKGEDFRKNEIILRKGQILRSQEAGLLAAFGTQTLPVYTRPIVGILSTGDEVVPIEKNPLPGQIRDINSYTLAGQVAAAGGIPVAHGIVPDDRNALYEHCIRALDCSDMLLISGGSSVGTRDYTIEILSEIPGSNILVHGISIRPGKPTILARVQNKAVWGLPGHVTSAMVVFDVVVRPFLEHLAGRLPGTSRRLKIPARLNRNIPSAQGRTDFIRVRLIHKDDRVWAEPVLGKSGLINTMVKADGLIEIDRNTEGLDEGTLVDVFPV